MASRPRDFGEKANDFWDQITAEYELSSSELRILEDICSEIEIIDHLTEQWVAAGRPVTSLGSMKQEVESAHLVALRQHRQVLRQLLAALALPLDDEDSGGKMSRTESARKAAMIRWRNHRGDRIGPAA